MQSTEPQVPEYIPRLIILLLNGTLKKKERPKLDDWLILSEENISLFEELIHGVEAHDSLLPL